MEEYLKNLFGITTLEERVEALERLLLHEKAKMNGYAVLKNLLK